MSTLYGILVWARVFFVVVDLFFVFCFLRSYLLIERAITQRGGEREPEQGVRAEEERADPG